MLSPRTIGLPRDFNGLKNRDAIASFHGRYLEPASLFNLAGPSASPSRPRKLCVDLTSLPAHSGSIAPLPPP
jgi:hypothetical protein